MTYEYAYMGVGEEVAVAAVPFQRRVSGLWRAVEGCGGWRPSLSTWAATRSTPTHQGVKRCTREVAHKRV